MDFFFFLFIFYPFIPDLVFDFEKETVWNHIVHSKIS